MTMISTIPPTKKVGASYSQTNVASGGTPSFTYTLTDGSLPLGTSLNASTGTVSGTPTTSGTFSYQITVTDSATPTPHTANHTTGGSIQRGDQTVSFISAAPSATVAEQPTGRV
ncbi:MAG: putative Ig domain-containing protein [Bauldia sp.]